MPSPDIAAILASLPPLNFAPASEAPVSDCWCLVAPADGEWCIARREDERGWFNAEGSPIDEPLVYAALPPAPGRCSPPMIGNLAKFISNLLNESDAWHR